MHRNIHILKVKEGAILNRLFIFYPHFKQNVICGVNAAFAVADTTTVIKDHSMVFLQLVFLYNQMLLMYSMANDHLPTPNNIFPLE